VPGMKMQIYVKKQTVVKKRNAQSLILLNAFNIQNIVYGMMMQIYAKNQMMKKKSVQLL
jgi:hypothetical protein